ncbi:MAG: XapX domain-containing protein [Endozoicomonas sp.]
MWEVFLAMLTGFIVGVIFSMFRLPIPAPPVLAGVMGIVGVYLGHECYQLIIQRFFS